ncbi:60S ribosomal export protein NMD3 [Coccinella septempunctata]|uniref:60S ribosomal export protein NMD3 n=1 Tax=Coccinella septempunctata TaxID=41139 RepID=UPI001D08968D|nr:60S ribosomal export protein NMD3 [Coccinella septempunctata]
MDYVQMSDPSKCQMGSHKIACCDCGVAIDPNPANMCVSCLRTRVDITEGIPKQVVIFFCRGCERFLQTNTAWIHAAPESKELLSLCLNKLRGLDKVKLVDSSFVWTEAHSRRIKLKLTVEGSLDAGFVLQQVFIVEYTVNHKMCDDCHRVEAKNFWKALVQVRQRAENKKTIYYLEQLMLKHRAHVKTTGMKSENDGFDFFFSTEAHARKFLDFVKTVLPVRYSHSKKLISHDIHSNLYNYKFTYFIEIVPVSGNSIVCLSNAMKSHLGYMAPICLVYKVSNSIHLIDPSSCRKAKVTGTDYWRNPFESICSPKQFIKYYVLNIEPVMDKDRTFLPNRNAFSKKHILADCWVVKESELGMTDNSIHVKTHLGHVLKVGDTVLGYDLANSNINNPIFDKIDSSKVPDVILVKKFYDHSERRKKRVWKLRHMADPGQGHLDGDDYYEFLDDLEEDPALRQNVNIFKDNSKAVIPVDSNDMDDETEPYITLEEMLDEMAIDDVEMEDSEL